MFSGIIEQSGVFQKWRTPYRIEIGASKFPVKMGDSIAINGVCLTVVSIKRNGSKMTLGFDVSPETLKKTNLKKEKIGSFINLEPALRADQALGGHIVQGHVDGVGTVKKIKPLGKNKDIWFSLPKNLRPYIVPKGSVTVNGVSLTVVELTPTQFSVALIPYTLERTNLGRLKMGDPVNLEADVLGKYVVQYLKGMKK